MKRAYYLLILFVIIFFFVWAFYSQQKLPKKEIITIPVDKESCELKGGLWKKAGMVQAYMCTIPYKDAGKTCTDSSQCFGRCIYTNFDDSRLRNVSTGNKLQVTGKCEADSSVFKCMTEVKNGFIESAIACADWENLLNSKKLVCYS